MRTALEEQRRAFARQQRNRLLEPLKPLVAKVNGNIEVLGFTTRQRRSFLDAVMRWGLPQEDNYNSPWFELKHFILFLF